MTDYPPYLNGYGQLQKLFERIRQADVPQRFTQDFLSATLELKSSTHRPMIPFLRRIGFLDSSSTPTSVYRDYRDEDKSKFIMAEQVKIAYSDLYKSHQRAHTLSKLEIISKLSSVLGVAKDDKILPLVASTFMALCKLSDFGSPSAKIHEPEKKETESKVKDGKEGPVELEVGDSHRLGISYTINLNLPSATDQKVFDAIFKSLKEHLLK